MKRIILNALVVTFFLGAPAWADPGEDRSEIEACGHGDEMQAARDALVAGDNDRALKHLKQARAILLECERRVAQEPELVPGPELGREVI